MPCVARVAGGRHHPLDPTLPEPARDDDTVEVPNLAAREQVRHHLGVHPVECHLRRVVEPRVAQCLHNREVRVGKVDVLADDPDAHGSLDRLHPPDQLLPLREVDRVQRLVDAERPADVVVEALLVEDERDLVDAARVDGRHHRLDRDVAEQRDLALEPVGDGLVAAADDHVGLDAPAPELGDRVLGGLGLLLPRRGEKRHEREVHVAHVVAPDVAAELADGLDERHDLDVTHRPPDLDDDHVEILVLEASHALFDLVGHVGNDLHGLAQVVPPAFLGDHRRVDRAGGRVGGALEALVDEALVVPEVEVGLAAVLGDEDLAVLTRVHGARVHVDVRVELAHRDPEPSALEEASEGGRREPLPERARDPAGDEDELAHRLIGPIAFIGGLAFIGCARARAHPPARVTLLVHRSTLVHRGGNRSDMTPPP